MSQKFFKTKIGVSTPAVTFTNAANANLQVSYLESNTLSFSGTSGQLFSVTDSMSGIIFGVNDVSGVPSIEVLDTGVVRLAETFGNVLIGTSTDNGSKLQVTGNISVTGTVDGRDVSVDGAKLDGIAVGATANQGTVTSVSGTGSYNGLTLSGTVTSSGSLTLGGTPTGTWPISVSGSAAGSTFSSDATTKDDITTRTETGFYESSTGTLAEGWPTNTAGWHHLIACTHSNDANYYSLQLSSTFYDQQLYFRATSGSGTTAWSTILHSGNYSTYTLPLSGGTVTGNISVTGTVDGRDVSVDGAKLDGIAVGATANQGTVTSVSGTGTVSGLSLSGTVTTTGNLTLGGTLSASISNISDASRWWNNFGDVHTTRTSFDATTPSYGHGWRYIQGSTNGPNVNSATGYYSLYTGLGNEYPATGVGSYGMQIAFPRNVAAPYITIRYNENNSLGSWRKISAGYADSAATATALAAGSADRIKLDGIATGATANQGTVTSVSGTGSYNGLTLSGTVTSSGSLTLGGTPTGTWPISITGSSATSLNTSSISSAVGGTYVWTGTQQFQSNLGTTLGALTSPALQVYSTSTNAAFMSFHRAGSYAVNLGLDGDNVLRIGGWSAPANRWQLDMSGNMTVSGNITAYSDARLKDNIEVITDPLTKIIGIRGVTFTRNDQENKERRHMGVIAQEVEQYFPEVVETDAAGIKTVNYGAMAGVFIEAFKEQQKQINELSTLVQQLVNK